MAEGLQLSDDELLKKQKDALDGSPAAGYDLLEYYIVYIRDHDQAMYWAQIAAENGEANNEFDYASYLSDDKGNLMSLIRARFWAKRALKNGHPIAKSLLSDIDKEIKALESKQPK